jgi:hypothetical protein
MRISTGNRHTQRHAATIGQHRSLDSQFAPICRISAGFFPRPRAPWWSNRRDFATSIECPEGHHTVATDTSKACGTHGVAPTLGSSGATNCRSQTLPEPPSIGSQFAGRKKYRRRPSVDRAVADLPTAIRSSAAGRAPCEPRDHREYANSHTFVQRAYENPP